MDFFHTKTFQSSKLTTQSLQASLALHTCISKPMFNHAIVCSLFTLTGRRIFPEITGRNNLCIHIHQSVLLLKSIHLCCSKHPSICAASHIHPSVLSCAIPSKVILVTTVTSTESCLHKSVSVQIMLSTDTIHESITQMGPACRTVNITFHL